MIYRLAFIFVLMIFFFAKSTVGFEEEAIFAEEHIYKKARPPPPVNKGITAPGTKWCGPGNTAANYTDLGTQVETDKCCRGHDHCENIILAQTTKNGIHNDDWFPIMKCKCDEDFLICLQKVNNMVSNTLGHIYFSSRGKCFSKGYPIVDCKSYQEGIFRKRCIKYIVNTKLAKIWQLYDTPFYTSPE